MAVIVGNDIFALSSLLNGSVGLRYSFDLRDICHGISDWEYIIVCVWISLLLQWVGRWLCGWFLVG